MNLTQLETAVANELGLSVSTEQTIIDSAINAAVQRVLEDTRCYVVRTDFADFDGTSGDWDMTPSDILDVVDMFITSGGVRYTLDRVSVEDLNERRRQGIPSGSPVMAYAVSGLNLLMFWPTPGASDTLSVYNVPVPTDLAAPTDDPSDPAFAGVPAILHKAIQYFACSELASYDDDQTSAQGQRYRDWYDKEIVRYEKIARRRGGARNARAIVNEKRIRRPFHDNSIYPA